MALSFESFPKDIYMLVCSHLDLAAAARLKVTSRMAYDCLTDVLTTSERLALHEHRDVTVSIRWHRYPYICQPDILLAACIHSHTQPTYWVFAPERTPLEQPAYYIYPCTIHVHEGLRVLEINIFADIVLIYVRRDGTAKHYVILLGRWFTVSKLHPAGLGDFVGKVLQLPLARRSDMAIYQALEVQVVSYNGTVREYLRGPAATLLEDL